MKINISLLFIILLWLTTNCQNESLPEKKPEEVQLQVVMAGKQAETRVTMDKNEFETPDKFRFFFNSSEPTGDPAGTGTGIGIADDLIKVADYTYSASNKWTYSHPIYWDDQKKIPDRKFCGVMPLSSSYDIETHTFTITEDQSATDGAGYKASDLMIARTITAKRLIPLKFWHALSRVVVNVTVSMDNENPDNCFAENALDNIAINLYQVYPKATISYATEPTPDTGDKPEYNPVITVGHDYTSLPTYVTMYQMKESTKDDTKKELTTSHVAVIPPQDIAANISVLTITLTEGTTKKNYYFKHDAITTFVQHKETVINVTLKKTKVDATGTIDIKPWGTIKAEGGGTIVL